MYDANVGPQHFAASTKRFHQSPVRHNKEVQIVCHNQAHLVDGQVECIFHTACIDTNLEAHSTGHVVSCRGCAVALRELFKVSSQFSGLVTRARYNAFARALVADLVRNVWEGRIALPIPDRHLVIIP